MTNPNPTPIATDRIRAKIDADDRDWLADFADERGIPWTDLSTVGEDVAAWIDRDDPTPIAHGDDGPPIAHGDEPTPTIDTAPAINLLRRVADDALADMERWGAGSSYDLACDVHQDAVEAIEALGARY